MDHSLEIPVFRDVSIKTSPLTKYEYVNTEIQLSENYYWDYSLAWIIHLLGRRSHKADHSKTSRI